MLPHYLAKLKCLNVQEFIELMLARIIDTSGYNFILELEGARESAYLRQVNC